MRFDPPKSRAEELWPSYHLTVLPEEGVACPYDPNGAIYWNGRYHLMYIYQDRSLPHGRHCWGHYSSADLVNWEIHPPCLLPETQDKDIGIFSGNAFVNKDGVPMLCWYGIEAGVCVATAKDDDLIEWEKHPHNPIIPTPQPSEPGHGVYGVFDPFLFMLGDQYVCLLSANRLPNGKDTQYVMTSPDLVEWTPRHALYEHPDLAWTLDSEDCSCPDFFPLNCTSGFQPRGERHVLLCISHNIGTRCYVGRFDEGELRFVPERHVRMNWPGGSFFAPESLLAPDGRRLFWGWITDVRVGPTREATGSGVQSLPRVMALDDDGGLLITPAEELQALRRNHRSIQTTEIDHAEITLPDVSGNTLELAVEIDPGSASAVGLKVCCSPDGREETAIWYDAARGRLIIDMTFSTLRRDVSYCTGPIGIYSVAGHETNKQMTNTVEAPFELREGEMLNLRVFLDGPVLEVFANDRQCVTTQVFPALPESRQVRFCARGRAARLVRGEAWEVAPIEIVNKKRRG